jgi:BirA family biotin operon repressor/biotin-[acetyl-CoA-carboxylase] ligase
LHKIFANTLFIGKQIISLPSCHSTNDLMAQMSAKNQLYEGAIIVTKHQTKGKGQRGNMWNSPEGKNLTFSIFLKPRFLKASQQFELNRMVSLALLDVVRDLNSAAKIFVKWPNDLMLNRKKVAGILIENSIGQKGISESVLGIGLNVNQIDEILPTATSLVQQFEQEYDLNEILLKIVQRIEHYYLIVRSSDFRFIHEMYESKLYLKDQVAYYEDASGKFNGIIRKVNPDGVLEIEDESGIYKKYHFKEVRLLS